MKNIILLIVDTLSYDSLASYPFPEELFINRVLKPHALIGENVFSQGPYTEAAMNGLLCGERCLDNGAFFFGPAKCPESLPQYLKKQGYATLCAHIDYAVFGQEWIGDGDHLYIGGGSHFGVLASYRLNHFSNLFRSGSKLNDVEMEALNTLVRRAFSEASCFWTDVVNNKPSSYLFHGLFDHEETLSYIEHLENEAADFEKDPRAYIVKVLKDVPQWLGRIYERVPQCHTELPNEYTKKNQPTLDYIHAQAEQKNARSMKRSPLIVSDLMKEVFSIKKLFKGKEGVRDYFYDIYKLLHFGECSAYYGSGKKGSLGAQVSSFDYWNRCGERSIKSAFDAVRKWINKQQQPFFAVMQPQDFHIPSVFWTYDQTDQNLFDEEMASAADLISRVPKSFVGNFFDMLSIKHLDRKIEGFYYSLQNDGVDLANTVFAIVSDHGCWNGALAKRRINGYHMMYRERAHVPFILHNPSMEQKTISSFHSLFVLPNTLLSLADVPECTKMYGRSIENDTLLGDFCIDENLGYGCPDLDRVPIIYTVHNIYYSCVFQVNIDVEPSLNSIQFFWDLKLDPLEQRPLKIRGRYLPIAAAMLNVVHKRHAEIQKQYAENQYYESPTQKFPK